MPATHTNHAPASGKHHEEQHRMMGHYSRLIIMTGLSFAAMYGLMYAMVDAFDHVYNSINQAYMAGLMAAAMVVIELAVMGSMYPNRATNVMLVVVSAVALIAFWGLIRTQSGIGDQQFLRSMIPHHSGAILMCEKARLTNPEIQELCKTIVEGQAAEIRQMKELLATAPQ